MKVCINKRISNYVAWKWTIESQWCLMEPRWMECRRSRLHWGKIWTFSIFFPSFLFATHSHLCTHDHSFPTSWSLLPLFFRHLVLPDCTAYLSLYFSHFFFPRARFLTFILSCSSIFSSCRSNTSHLLHLSLQLEVSISSWVRTSLWLFWEWSSPSVS